MNEKPMTDGSTPAGPEHHPVTGPLVGTIITCLSFAAAHISELKEWLQIIAFLVAIGSGMTTIYVGLKKGKKRK